jgi:hypothetical protein
MFSKYHYSSGSSPGIGVIATSKAGMNWRLMERGRWTEGSFNVRQCYKCHSVKRVYKSHEASSLERVATWKKFSKEKALGRDLHLFKDRDENGNC